MFSSPLLKSGLAKLRGGRNNKTRYETKVTTAVNKSQADKDKWLRIIMADVLTFHGQMFPKDFQLNAEGKLFLRNGSIVPAEIYDLQQDDKTWKVHCACCSLSIKLRSFGYVWIYVSYQININFKYFM